eukprot:scaffold233394_cov32-Tisochrysis_lutea.AAC.1
MSMRPRCSQHISWGDMHTPVCAFKFVGGMRFKELVNMSRGLGLTTLTLKGVGYTTILYYMPCV